MDIFDSIAAEDLRKVLYIDRFTFSRRTPEKKQALLASWMDQLLRLNLKMPKICAGEALFFRSLVRDDYKKLFHTVIEAAALVDSIIVEDYVSQERSFNLEASHELSKAEKLIRKLEIKDPLEATACVVRLIHYGMIVKALTEYDFRILITFSDMQPVEHLAALYFKAQEKVTISLQHGLYIDYGDADTVNVINYKHQPSDNFLAWGKHTADLIKAHNPNTNVVICGKPDLARLCPLGTYAGDVKAEIIVIMDQEVFQKQNVAMLGLVYDYAAKHQKSVCVRFHPHNNQAFYRKIFPDIEEKRDITGASALVGHTSSLLFEAAAIGLPTVQFASETPTIPLAVSRRFTDATSLEFALRNARVESSEGHSQSIIASIAEESRAQYHRFFEEVKGQRKRPQFSVIVPCFNSGMHLTTALESTLNQTCQDIEVIIADGLSTDYTLQIAMDYARNDPRVRIFSQPDTGVYDAMNKGLARAVGDWVIFMGSDDEFSDPKVLEKVGKFAAANPDAGMIYGCVRVVGDVKWAQNGTIYDGPFSVEKIKSKNICHQAIFYRRTDHIDIGEYNLKYRLCADWDMNLRFWSKKNCMHIDLVISNFNAGGASTAGTDPEFGKDFVANKKKYFSEVGTLTNV